MKTSPKHNRFVHLAALVAVAAVPMVGSAADPVQSDLQKRIDQLEKQLQQIKADQKKTQTQQDETRNLIDGALQGGVHADGEVAGKGKKFFLASPDGAFTLNFDGQIQPRFIYQHSDGVADSSVAGFQMRRAKVGFSGNIHHKNLKYKIKAGYERSGGAFSLEEAYAQWKLDGGNYIKAGQFKGRFMHEELVSSSKQMVVERSGVNEFFTLDYSQGVEFGGKLDDQSDWSILWHDGRENENIDVPGDFTDFAIAGRVESTLVGDRKRLDDFATWSKDMGEALLIGGGFDYEISEGGVAAVDWDSFLQWTVDVHYENDGWSIFGAIVGRCVDRGVTGPDADQMGYVVQVSKSVVPDKQDVFFRFELIDPDGFEELDGHETGFSALGLGANVDDKQTIFTVGTNLYEHKHASKVTVDLSYAPDGIRFGESGAGNSAVGTLANEQSALIFRLQYQLLF